MYSSAPPAMYSGLTIMRIGSPGASRTKANESIVMPKKTGTEMRMRLTIQRHMSGSFEGQRPSISRYRIVHSDAFQKPKVNSPWGLIPCSLSVYAHTADGTYNQMYGTSSLVTFATVW